MKWENCFAMGSAGTFVLYCLPPEIGTGVFCIRSMETDEPVKWICSRAAASAWLQREALLDREEVDHIFWGADEWHKTKSSQAAVSRRLASIPAAAKPVAGPLPPS